MAIVGVASVKIKPDLTEFRRELKDGLARIKAEISVGVKADVSEARKDIAAFKAVQEKDAITKKVKFDASQFEKFGKSLGSLNSIAASAAKASVSFLVMSSASQAMVPALAAAAGAAALLPAAAAAGGAALLTVKLGTDGVKKAFEGLKTTMDRLKGSVSATFEKSLAPAITNLKKTLPGLTGGFQGIAREMSSVVVQVTSLLRVPANFRAINGLLGVTATLVRNVGAALAPLLVAFINIAAIGGSFLTAATSGFAAAAQRAADFTASADGIARITGFIKGAIEAFRFLAEVVTQVVAIFGALFGGLQKGAGDLGGTFLPVLRSINTALSMPAGQAALAALGRAMSEIGKAVGGQLLSAFQALLPVITGVLTFIGDHADAVVSLVISLAILGKTISILVIALKAWEAVQIVLNVLMTANPVGLIIVAIGVLIAAIVLVVTHLDFFRGVWDSVWKFVSDVITEVGDFIGGVIDSIVKYFSDLGIIISNVGTWFANVGSAIVNAFKTALTFIQSLPARIGAFLASLPGIIWEAFVAAFKFALNAVVQGTQWIIAAILALPILIFRGLVKLGELLWQAFVAAFQFVTQTLPGLILGVIQFFLELPGKIIAAVANFGGMLLEWITNAWNQLMDAALTAGANLVTFMRELPGRILTAIAQFASQLVQWGRNAFNQALSAITTGAQAIWTFVQSIPGRIMSALGNMGSLLLGAGGDLIRGLWNGISGAASWLWGKITGFVDGIVDKFKSILSIFSPSRVMRDEVGRYIAEGVGVGITQNSSSVTDAFQGMTDDLLKQAQGTNLGSMLSSAFTGQMAATLGVTNDPTPIPVMVTVDVNDGPLKDLVSFQIDEGNRDVRRNVKAGVGGSI